MDDLVTLISRRRGQAPPAWVLFEALVDPFTTDVGREWFDVRPGEQPPTILEQQRPDLVVWSSIWTDIPGCSSASTSTAVTEQVAESRGTSSAERASSPTRTSASADSGSTS